MKSLIERYKQGDDLSEEELDQATQEMLKTYQIHKWKKKFEGSVEGGASSNEGLRSVKEDPPLSIRPPYRLTRRYLAAAAAILIFMLMLPMYFYQGTPTTVPVLAEQYITENTFPISPNRMGNETEGALWLEAKKAYQETDYEQAVKKISQIAPKNQEQLFYLGLSYLYQSPSNEAKVIEILQKARQLEGRFKHEINWYLSLAYLKNGQTLEAKKELENIVQLDRWKLEEAKKLLEEL